MAGLLACIELAVKRFESGNDTDHDRTLLSRYGKIDAFTRTVKFNLPSIVEKTGLHETILSTRLSHGAGMSASVSGESEGCFSGLSTRSQSKRATGLVHTANQRVTKMLNGSR